MELKGPAGPFFIRPLYDSRMPAQPHLPCGRQAPFSLSLRLRAFPSAEQGKERERMNYERGPLNDVMATFQFRNLIELWTDARKEDHGP